MREAIFLAWHKKKKKKIKDPSFDERMFQVDNHVVKVRSVLD